MRILQINSFCGRGSTGHIAVDLYHMATEQGHICRIAYGREDQPPNVKAIRIGNKENVYKHVIMSRLTDRQGFYSKAATKKLVENIEEFSPNIIHLHNLHGYYVNLPILFQYLSKNKKKVIWTLHDCWAFTGHCSYFTANNCSKWKRGCFQCPQKQQYPKSFLLDSSENNYREKKDLFNKIEDMILVTPSKWLADLVKQSFLKNYSVEVIPNGIDTEIFRPRNSNFKEKYGIEEKLMILGVANVWTERKGLNDFLKLSKLLDPKTQKIVLVGLNKRQMKYLPKTVIGIPRTSSMEELAEIYTAADIFFNPTYEDNYPTTNLEAAACGARVVTYDAGGSTETLIPQNGIALKIGEYQKVLNVSIEKNLEKINYENLDRKERFKKYIGLYEYCVRRK